MNGILQLSVCVPIRKEMMSIPFAFEAAALLAASPRPHGLSTPISLPPLAA
ncbi:hypothetical protein [Candidatus Regiella insecticola]|uniref:hypothetical protein n=1 Tax=Candidatus Regiella insecticola TaxID=138073 RepID=UPI00159E5415|nr:hypothetical protein [Candidatus Regiella insecticola]